MQKKLPGSLPQQREAAEIEAHLASFTKVTGNFDLGDLSSSFEAYFDKGVLRFIREESDSNEEMRGINQYYYAHGRLFYYLEHNLSTAAGQQGTQEVKTEMRLIFDDQQNVLDHEKKIDGHVEDSRNFDVQATLIHEKELRQAAEEQYGSLRPREEARPQP